MLCSGMIYSIRRLKTFEAMFNRIARKAVKLGLTPPSFKVIGERVETATVYEVFEGKAEEVGTEPVTVNDIEITGLDPVVIPGWALVATVETTANGNLIYKAPGETVPDRFSTSGCHCDHCGLRRNRSRTFILKSGEGEFKQIGLTCLKDFSGGHNPEHLARLFEFVGAVVHDLDVLRQREAAGWEGGSAAYPLIDVVAKSIEAQEKYGWLSRSSAYEGGGKATADRVKEAKPDEFLPSSESVAKAEAAINYFATLPESVEGDLPRNARVLACSGWCSDRSFGLACALWTCYQIAVKRAEREAAKERQRQTSRHLWEVGQRVRGIVATVVNSFSFDTAFGLLVTTILEDEAGNVLVARDVGKVGDRLRFDATVKEHSTFDGVAQTKLIRASKIALLNGGSDLDLKLNS